MGLIWTVFHIDRRHHLSPKVYVMPAASLITDAKARNRVFEEVLRFNTIKDDPAIEVPECDLIPPR